MTQKTTTQRTLREYFTACLLAVFTSFAGLTESDGFPGRGLWLVGLVALLMAIFVYFQFRKQAEDTGENLPVPLAKLKRMSVLWYVLTVASSQFLLLQIPLLLLMIIIVVSQEVKVNQAKR